MEMKNFLDLIKYSIGTMFVMPSEKNGYFCPVNLILIAPPECGKTKIIKNFKCRSCLELVDLSSKTLSNNVIPLLERGDIKFIIIPDMIQLIGHKIQTSQATIQLLNAIIEEGVKDSLFFGQEFHLKKSVNCGLITGVTTSKFFQNVKRWDSIGFIHRLLPITYDYSDSTIRKIHNEIAEGRLIEKRDKFDIARKNPMKIKIPQGYAMKIVDLSLSLSLKLNTFHIRHRVESKMVDMSLDIKGFRIHDRLRQLARSICFLDSKGKRDSVNEDDILKLTECVKIINFPNTKTIV